jgi:hypothetical protein
MVERKNSFNYVHLIGFVKIIVKGKPQDAIADALGYRALSRPSAETQAHSGQV